MGFPRQEEWSGLPFSSPGDLPDPGIEPVSPALAGVLGAQVATVSPGKPMITIAFWDTRMGWQHSNACFFLSFPLTLNHFVHVLPMACSY